MTPPRPTPTSSRPSLRLSSMLISSIKRSGMMQREHVDTGAESQACRPLGHARQEDVLGRSEAVDGGRVVLGQVRRPESRGVPKRSTWISRSR